MKRRVFITTDIGGSDPDDYQSLIHALLYADEIDIEGIVCGYPRGKKSAAMRVLKAYEKDYPKLKEFGYPEPSLIKDKIYQGSEDKFKPGLISNGGRALCVPAMNNDERPLIVCVWGACTELAEALYLYPSIASSLFVYVIASWNREQDPAAHKYLYKHKELRWINCESTFRGMYLTGNGEGKYGNIGFVEQVAKNSGHLGRLFRKVSTNIDVNKGGIKMGDTPSFLFALRGDLKDPTADGWGGAYRKVTGKHWEDMLGHSIAGYRGAKTVAKHRRAILEDFEKKLMRLR
jgi:hypothetical protein